ncbi:MAG: glycosyltransferase family 2 protein [Ignavibacteriales bacterium]
MNNSKDKNNINTSVCAVIPFYNEKETLHKTLNETCKYVQFIFAIDDGSNDAWQEIKLDRPEIKYISLGKNSGKGRALKVGFENAVSEGFEYVITLDADLQHEPKYIPQLLERTREFDIVIGNRLYDLKQMPLQRRLSNKITSFLLSKKTGQKILDSQCGFRAYSSKVFKEVKTFRNGFEAESEIIVIAARNGSKIGFVDIPAIYGNEKSKMRAMQAIIGFIKVLFS